MSCSGLFRTLPHLCLAGHVGRLLFSFFVPAGANHRGHHWCGHVGRAPVSSLLHVCVVPSGANHRGLHWRGRRASSGSTNTVDTYRYAAQLDIGTPVSVHSHSDFGCSESRGRAKGAGQRRFEITALVSLRPLSVRVLGVAWASKGRRPAPLQDNCSVLSAATDECGLRAASGSHAYIAYT